MSRVRLVHHHQKNENKFVIDIINWSLNELSSPNVERHLTICFNHQINQNIKCFVIQESQLTIESIGKINVDTRQVAELKLRTNWANTLAEKFVRATLYNKAQYFPIQWTQIIYNLCRLVWNDNDNLRIKKKKNGNNSDIDR